MDALVFIDQATRASDQGYSFMMILLLVAIVVRP